MPVTVSYPGVYVQEIPSGQQTISGVATSITAFVGRTYRGPVNQATTIFSFADFQRGFGGLSNGYPLGFAVRDFFQNGGSQAIIVRVYGPSWLGYPVSEEQQNNAAKAAQTVINAVSNSYPTTSDAVTTAAASAQASYYGGTYPEQYQTATYMADQASAWSTAVDAATVTGLTTLLGEVSATMQSGAAAVITAMESPQSYPTYQFPQGEITIPLSPPDSPPAVWPDATAVVDVAQAAAAAQIPGTAQDAAYLVANAVQAYYDNNPTADYAALVLDAAIPAQNDVNKGLQALAAASPPSATETAEAYLLELAQLVEPAGDATEQDAALIAVNALMASVLPAFQFPNPLAIGTTVLGEQYLTQLYDEDLTTSPAVTAALPPTTASIPLAVPVNFTAVAQAANSVAQAAWLAALAHAGQTSGMPVATAAQEQAAYVKTSNPALPAASQAATTVASAVAGGLLGGPLAAAQAATNAVAGAVASALQLTGNGSITGLASAQAVAYAAWTEAYDFPNAPVNASVLTAAINAAASRPAAQAAAAYYEGGSTRAAAVSVSQNLVNATVGALPSLTLNAANPGEWANGSLTVTLNTNGITAAAVASMNLTPAPGNAPFSAGDLFNLAVGYTAPDGSTMSETWNGVSLRWDAGAQRIDRVLSNSSLIQYLWPGYTPGATYPTATPPPVPVSGAQGVAGVPLVAVPPTYGVATSQITEEQAAAAALMGTASAPLQLDDLLGSQTQHTGIYALDHVDQFDLLCIPPDTQIETLPPAIPPVDPDDQWRLELYQTAAQYCSTKYAMLIIDPPTQWAIDVGAGNTTQISINDLGTYGPEGEYAAVYFPYLIEGNPLLNGQLGYFAPSGAMAGIMARTDAARGVWKAPAGINDGAISGTMGLELKLSDNDSGLLNPQGINCLRTFPVYGNVVWGARTLKGADVLNNDYKYVPVRRLALYIEASLLRGLQWAVFEPNADPLWSSIRLTVNSFMNTLFRQGAFAGSTAKDAYFVACDSTTTTQTDIEQGIVNVTIGFAPLLPAEFVVITIQQLAGQTPT